MAMAKARALPPLEQYQRLEALLAELKPLTPTGVAIEPEWTPEFSSWKLWITDRGSASGADLLHFGRIGQDLVEKHGLDADLIPAELRDGD
jgi:hypothetical protein